MGGKRVGQEAHNVSDGLRGSDRSPDLSRGYCRRDMVPMDCLGSARTQWADKSHLVHSGLICDLRLSALELAAPKLVCILGTHLHIVSAPRAGCPPLYEVRSAHSCMAVEYFAHLRSLSYCLSRRLVNKAIPPPCARPPGGYESGHFHLTVKS